ncbi:MAG TPA: hypothetical protein PLD02_05580 [Saprospiraceae bacterium]|nr:hypothetical protein [Saprospiraceae bacterium]
MTNINSTMKSKNIPNVYKQAQRFANLTKELIVSGNNRITKNCLHKAEYLFVIGTNEMKNAIVNVYVFSVTNFMELHHTNIPHFLQKTLNSEYQKLIYSSRI